MDNFNRSQNCCAPDTIYCLWLFNKYLKLTDELSDLMVEWEARVEKNPRGFLYSTISGRPRPETGRGVDYNTRRKICFTLRPLKVNKMTNAFHLMAKPAGPVCNLRCEYCFYAEKKTIFNADKNYRMPDDVLEQYIKKYLTTQDVPEVSFVWQGGEPTLLGVDFFKMYSSSKKNMPGGRR